MIIYNVTIQPIWEIHDEWKKWMLEIHLPEMMGTDCFIQYQFCRLIGINENEGPTYTIQYSLKAMEDYDRYIQNHSTHMRQKGVDLWKDKMIAYRSLMEVVH